MMRDRGILFSRHLQGRLVWFCRVAVVGIGVMLIFGHQVDSFSLSPRTPRSRVIGSTGRIAHGVGELPVSATNVDGTQVDVVQPELGTDGIYHITTGEQHKAFIDANQDKLVVLKVFAPWCRACKGLEPRFNAIVKEKTEIGLPIVWADLTIQGNKDYVKSIGVLALPTVQFYVHGSRVDTFPCGPSKVPILKRKLEQLIVDNVDTSTNMVKDRALIGILDEGSITEEGKSPPLDAKTGGAVDIPDQLRKSLRSLLYFAEMSDDEFETVLSKAKELTFQQGSIIMREGNIGRTFYILTEGEVEICQKTSMEDPLTTPPTYLGTVINRLEAGDVFGERALITKEPRAASIRASSELTKCLVIDKDDFPPSCPLSGKTDFKQTVEDYNEKYGVMLKDMTSVSQKQLDDTINASQVRGSVNKPGLIIGVDTDDVIEDDEESVQLGLEGDAIIPLLMRFRLLRSVGRCFDYIMKSKVRFGDEGGRRRRAMLVKRLAPSQHVEFTDAFTLIDADGDGSITLMEMRRIMDSVGQDMSDDDLLQVIQKGQDMLDNKEAISYQDFMGIMAEAELYYLFRDTFRALDERDSGFVRARDLDRVLCGVRDLISDDRKSIIDVEDADMLIDYEQFSQMLLGKALT